MQIKERNGIQWIQFDLLADIPSLTHAVFLRSGGHSSSPYTSLNMCDRQGDDPESVMKNRQLVCEILEIPELVSMQQYHSKEVYEVKETCSKPIHADALTTIQPLKGLLACHADCQAAIMYDPIHHAIANVHSGWRGSVQNIYAATIDFMKQAYHTQPQDLLVGISPSLGPQDAEFINHREELPESFWRYQIKPNYFDFWTISRDQLKQCGVLDHHIEIAEISTLSSPEKCFSYRRDKVTGRHGTVVMLYPKSARQSAQHTLPFPK